MAESKNSDLDREERRARIRAKKRRQIKAVLVLAASVLGVLLLLLFVSRAIKKQKDAGFSQIGPFPPTETDEVISVKQVYDYFSQVPKAEAIHDSFFSSALFIGDVRVEGMGLYYTFSFDSIYGGSMTAQSATSGQFTTKDGSQNTVAAACVDKESIYIMLGLNETGWAYPDLYEEYLTELISTIRAINPNASVYVCSTVPLTESAAQGRSYMTEDLVSEMSKMALRAAASERVYYLNIAEALAPDGWLSDDYSEANGISLNKAGYETLLDYLKTHTVNKELYS